MNVLATSLPGVLLIEPRIFCDECGFFLETYSAERYQAAGIPFDFVQDNHSRSSKGVLRGLHFQLNHPQGKLVRVLNGTIFNVAVDIRKGSPFFGKIFTIELTHVNKLQLYIPKGFAHGFQVTSRFADVVFKCSDFYVQEDQKSLSWSDPILNIPWPIKVPILSSKDSGAMCLDYFYPKQLPTYNK